MGAREGLTLTIEPVATTKRLELRPLADPEDLAFAHRLLTSPDASAPFRWYGATPSYDQFVAELFAPTLIGLVAASKATGERRGIVLVTSPDLRDGHAYLSVAAVRQVRHRGHMVEAALAAIACSFEWWGFHKLYADTDEDALPQFASAIGRLAKREGVFRDHVYRSGRRLDVHRLALFRDVWDNVSPRYMKALEIQIRSARPPHLGQHR